MLTGCLVFQEMRKTCKLSSHKSHVSRLLFILTRCSRLVLSGEQCHFILELHLCPWICVCAVTSMPRHCWDKICILIAEEPSPMSNNTAMYGTQPRNRTHQKQRRFSGFPFTSQRPYGGVHKKLGSPRSPIARATTLPTRCYYGNINMWAMQMSLAPYQVFGKNILPNPCTVPSLSCVKQWLCQQQLDVFWSCTA